MSLTHLSENHLGPADVFIQQIHAARRKSSRWLSPLLSPALLSLIPKWISRPLKTLKRQKPLRLCSLRFAPWRASALKVRVLLFSTMFLRIFLLREFAYLADPFVPFIRFCKNGVLCTNSSAFICGSIRPSPSFRASL